MSQNFFNENAFAVCIWSYEEKDRVKASKIYSVALQMENRYRKHRRIPNNCDRLIGSHIVIFPRSESLAAMKARYKNKEKMISN